MAKSKFLCKIGNKEYYYNGKHYYYRKKLKTKYSKLIQTNSIDVIKKLLSKA